jgi:hypothetical protein
MKIYRGEGLRAFYKGWLFWSLENPKKFCIFFIRMRLCWY